jgi:hypothetical protein
MLRRRYAVSIELEKEDPGLHLNLRRILVAPRP